MVKLGVWKDGLSSGLMIKLRGMSPSLTPEDTAIIQGAVVRQLQGQERKGSRMKS